jgi:endo-1,4-beta-D-glucanase Y
LYTIIVNKVDAVEGDSVTVSPAKDENGAKITISYTLAPDKINNRLVFSGTAVSIAQVDDPGSGTREYIIDKNDADSITSAITIIATFTHTDKNIDTIAFSDNVVHKTYGDAAFPEAVSISGTGTGAITYASSNTDVATVNNSGQVTIVKVGSCTITATKAADNEWEGTTANYALHIAPLQLTVSGTTVTQSRAYNSDTTAAVTNAGTLTNKVGSDDVTVSATAAYNSPNVNEANKITVTYAIAGADAGNYIKPVDYEITSGVSITKAAGGTVSAPTESSKTNVIIIVHAVTASTGQPVEYAISEQQTEPSTGWQSSTSFSGLTHNTAYYVFARAAANNNYNQGAAAMSAAITTNETPTVPPVKVDFETDALNKTYSATSGNNSASSVHVLADPAASNQKSLRMVTGANNSTGRYNIAPIIPITIPYALENWGSLTFRIYLDSGTYGSSPTVSVYAAGSAAQFVRYGFGNPANSEHPQFANLLLGEVQAESTTGSWQNLSININSSSTIKNTIYLAIGINNDHGITYYLDDITFNISSTFVPPPPPPAAPAPASFPAAVPNNNYRNLFKERGKWTDAEIDAKVQAAWNQLFVNGTADQKIFIEVGNDMAYIYDSGNSDVRSEGMSYGMMMAVQMNDKTRFDKLWKWAHTYMYNDRNTNNTGKNIRGFFKWQVRTNGTEIDNAPAADGEFYFVTALLFASARWGDGSGINEYGRYARYIMYDMLHRFGGTKDNYGAIPMINPTHKVPEFTTVSSQHTDPSYILPAFYDVWAIEIENGTQYHDIWGGSASANTDAAYWRQVATAGRAFFHTTVNSTTGLGPDYAAWNGAGTGKQPHFEYDAWRIAMNIGMDYSWWAQDPWQITQSDRIQSFFHSKGVESYGALWTLDGNLRPGDDSGAHSPGLVACNAVASLAASQQITWDFIDNFWDISTTTGQYRYYDGCLYMMGLLHVSGKFKAYLSSGSTVTPSSTITPTTATFDKKTGAQADVTVTMTLNGNTFTNITNAGTPLTQGNNGYTVSGSAVSIKAAYLATQSVGTTTLTFNFSAGQPRTIAITIMDTTGGGPIGGSGGTEYNFANGDNPAVTTVGTGINAVITDGVLKVTRTAGYGSALGVVIPFDLGATNLSSYTKLTIVLKGSGDTQQKTCLVEYQPSGTTVANPGGNNTFGSVFTGNSALTQTPVTWTINKSGSPSATGPIQVIISFGSTGTSVHDIISIKFE